MLISFHFHVLFSILLLSFASKYTPRHFHRTYGLQKKLHFTNICKLFRLFEIGVLCNAENGSFHVIDVSVAVSFWDWPAKCNF